MERRMGTMWVAASLVRVVAVVSVTAAPLAVQEPAASAPAPPPVIDATDPAARLGEGYDAFYNARYEEAASIGSALLVDAPDSLDGLELRTSAYLFRLKAIIGDAKNKDKAVKECAVCADLLSTLTADTRHAQTLARARLKTDPEDENTRFLLGKIDLNYLWLQLGPLGKRAGWDEYWEARRSLDDVLAKNPGHTRAKVARAWMDYIVDTRVPWGTKWILGGGSRKKALVAVREAAIAATEPLSRAEAGFALWEMELREKNHSEALVVANGLLVNFPENKDLVKFVAANQ